MTGLKAFVKRLQEHTTDEIEKRKHGGEDAYGTNRCIEGIPYVKEQAETENAQTQHL